jgi:hypothetical protein
MNTLSLYLVLETKKGDELIGFWHKPFEKKQLLELQKVLETGDRFSLWVSNKSNEFAYLLGLRYAEGHITLPSKSKVEILKRVYPQTNVALTETLVYHLNMTRMELMVRYAMETGRAAETREFELLLGEK